MAKKNLATLAPSEYVAIAGVLALFAGLMVLMVTRDIPLAMIASGAVFVVVIMALAALMLAMTPNTTPEGERDRPETGND